MSEIKKIKNSLLSCFPEEGLLKTDLRVIAASEVPETHKELLVHEVHMTATLEKYFGCKLALNIKKTRHEDDDYSRQLVLHAGKNGPALMASIIRIHLQFFGQEITKEIIEGKIPLGRILIENVIQRRVESIAYLRVKMGSKLRAMFEVDDQYNVTFGRLARIICENEPAVEMLEIIGPKVPQKTRTELG